MNTIKSWLRPLRRMALVLVTGVFLVFGTACSRQDTPIVSTTDSATGTQGQDIELYDTIQTPKSGMNTYEDAMPGRPEAGTSAEVRALKDSVERTKSTSDNTVLDAIKDIPDSAKEFAGDAKRSIASSVDDLKDSAEDYPDRTQRNLSRIGDYVEDQADKAVSNAKSAAKSAKKSAKQQAASLKDNVEDVVESGTDL